MQASDFQRYIIRKNKFCSSSNCVQKTNQTSTMEVKSSWDTCENRPKNHQRIIWYYYSYFLGHNLSVIPPLPPNTMLTNVGK